MTTPKRDNTYIVADISQEVVRLERQALLFNDAMHEPLSEQADCDAFRTVLDIGCGPGTWAHMIANQCPGATITGVDTHEASLAYAQRIASVRGLPNVTFRRMNVLDTLDFPDGAFDLVNMRCAMSFVKRDVWPVLLRECVRVLSPGGVLRWTEADRGKMSTGAAYQTLLNAFRLALCRAGYSLSDNGRDMGSREHMSPLLENAGLQDVQQREWIADYSYGTPHYRAWRDIYITGMAGLKAFTVNAGVMSSEDYDTLYKAAQVEMMSASFRVESVLVTAWGKKL